jgi:predicted DNA-binding transcriptional regulator AlpA
MKPSDPTTSEDAPAEAPQGVQPRLLKIAATAALLGVSTGTVERLHASGRMPAPIRLCRDLLWDADELNAWLDYARGNGGKPPSRKEWVAVRDVLLNPSRN